MTDRPETRPTRSGGIPQPSAEMQRIIEIDARIARDQPRAAGIADERANRYEAAHFWNEGLPELACIDDLTVRSVHGEVPVRVYRPSLTRPLPIVLMMYGGGWVFGSIHENEPVTRHLAAKSQAIFVALNYRLAPENRFPAALVDCEAVLNWLLQGNLDGGDPSRIGLSGASAGANLAASIALRAPAASIKAQALFYGVFGNSFETASYEMFGDGRFGLSRDRMKFFFDSYVPDGVDRGDPAITPLKGDLKRLPPTWLCAAECDVLYDDTLELYARLQDLRGGDELVVGRGLKHGFVNKVRELPSAIPIFESAAAFLTSKLAE